MTIQEQKQFIKEHYLDVSIKGIARNIGRSQTFVRAEMNRQGLVVPKHILEQRKKDSQYKKGQEPANKGVPIKEWMSKEGLESSRNTRFKKGHKPHNTREDGDISIRQDTDGRYYKHIRISLSNWQLLHRHIWEQHNGPIPKDHVLVFKNGDSLDVLKSIESNTFEALITDPPYGLSKMTAENIQDCLTSWLKGEKYTHKEKGFMGKAWDSFVPRSLES